VAKSKSLQKGEHLVGTAKFVVSFVVDQDARFQTQAWLLLHNLEKLGTAERAQILLNHCGPLSSELREKAETCGALIKEIPRYGDGPAAYCNKLQQFDNVINSGATHAVLCDTDIGFLIDPCAIATRGATQPDAIRAKPVDKSNPPEAAFRAILDLAGFPQTPLDYLPEFFSPVPHNIVKMTGSAQPDMTHKFNCNGGLYCIPVQLLRQLAPVWRRWAEFCLGQSDLLGRSAIHSDQMSFALAMQELQLPFDPLESDMNFPLHFAPNAYHAHSSNTPQVLHYHREMEPNGALIVPEVAGLSASVRLFNSLVSDARVHAGFQALLNLTYQENAA
jgi:hypothetical protein